MFYSPIRNVLLSPKVPRFQFLDLRTDATDLTTYTFTNVNIGDFGTDGDSADYGVNPHVRSPSHKMIWIIVHSEDALATYTVTNVTIGGNGGNPRVEAGGLIAADTSIWFWTGNALDTISSRDVVVTFSEAVTSCAIGVVSVDNIGVRTNINNGSTSGTGVLTSNLTHGSFAVNDAFPFMLVGTTCVTGALAETVQFSSSPIHAAGMHPMLLYEGSNAEMSYAAAWTYASQYSAANSTVLGIDTSWSGAGSADVAATIFI